MNAQLESKLKQLPISSGVYLHKSSSGEIIYVGKASVLRNRVRQYFLKSKEYDIKTRALINEIADTDWIETESEIDALFLESELVKRYKPKFNVLLRDDKSLLYVRIDMKSEWPHVSFTRNPSDDGAEYFGPYYNGFAIKKALRYLRKVFPYFVAKPKFDTRPDLDVHIGLSPDPNLSSVEYKKTLKQLIRYIRGDRDSLVREIEKNMHVAAKNHEYENAAKLRNQLADLKELKRRIMFGDKESLDISKDQALSDVAKLLGLIKEPKRIEGYDISHMSGTDVVASMVVFTNGVSDRSEYRKFKTSKDINNDFANMNETLMRRFSEKNKSWGTPDLIIIDGGKGQLDAALKSIRSRGIETPCIGLAKKHEEIVVNYAYSNVNVDSSHLEYLKGSSHRTDKYITIRLPHSSHLVKLFQRVRDESHRFAVSYHSTLKKSRQTKSQLSEVKGIGPASQKKLLKTFGSLKGIQRASVEEVAEVIGNSRARLLKDYIS